MLYFSLVSTWENIPLILEESKSDDIGNFEVSQSSPKEVYNHIIEDLLFAESVLDEVQGQGRATKGAAQALLAKIHMQQNDYSAAEQILSELIGSDQYKLNVRIIQRGNKWAQVCL